MQRLYMIVAYFFLTLFKNIVLSFSMKSKYNQFY